MADPLSFIQAHTTLTELPFLPEVKLSLAEKMEGLWKTLEAASGDPDCPPPFWAFAWAGGQGLARYILDNPAIVEGKRVLDFASGSGLVGIAASMAGAKKVWACDIDPLAQIAGAMNAKANHVPLLQLAINDMKRSPKGVDLILAGDVCYDHLMAHRVLAWLRICAANGIEVLLGDPGRAYVPKEGVQTLATLTVPTSLELEDTAHREVAILRLG